MDIENCQDYQPILRMTDLKERLARYNPRIGKPHTYTASPLDTSHPIVLNHIINFLTDSLEALEKEVANLKQNP